MKIPRLFLMGTWIWIGLFLGCGIVCPLVSVLFLALQGGPSGAGSVSVFDPVILSIFKVTFYQAFCSTVISSAAGLFLGLWMGRLKGNQRLFFLLTLPYGVPTVVVGLAWLAWLGRMGILAQMGLSIEWLYSLKAVVLAHVFLNIPLVTLAVAQARSQIPEGLLEVAQTLGADQKSLFRWMIWPGVRRAFLSVSAQVMSLCSMSFALVLILGGGPPVETLETALFAQLRKGHLNFSGAAVCALWELVLTLTPWMGMLLLERNRKDSLFLKATREVKKSRREGERQLWVRRGLWIMVLGFILPYAVLIHSQVFSILLDPQIREPLKFSFYLAVVTALGAVGTAVCALVCIASLKSRPRLREGLLLFFYIPSGISILVLGLGVWISYGRWIDPLEKNFVLLTFLQMTLFFPVAFRILWPQLQGVPHEQLEVAATLGTTPLWGFLKIDGFRWRTPLLCAFAAVAGASLGEIGAVSLFYHEKQVTLPLLVSRWMEQYRFEEAEGVASLLLILSVVVMGISMGLGNRRFVSSKEARLC